jgi:thioredoxin 1
MVHELNESNFQNFISTGLVLVDFWADDCNPCKEMLGILETFASHAPASLKIGKLNGNANISIVQQYRIMSVPSLIFFLEGKPVEMLIGVQTIETLIQKSNTLLAS